MKKRLTALLLTFVMLFCFSFTAFAESYEPESEGGTTFAESYNSESEADGDESQETESETGSGESQESESETGSGESTDTTEEDITAASYVELLSHIENGETAIEITDTIYVAGALGQYDKTITLTRSSDFVDGPILQIEYGSIKNLIIDGASITTEGSAAVICEGGYFENVSFMNCSAGALLITEGTIMFDDCIFSNNANDEGAHVENTAEAVFTRCTFTNGQASTNGGAIKNTGTMQLQNCTFSENITGTDAVSYGGGAVYTTGNLYAFGTSFTANTSMQGGALNNLGSAELVMCTFADNSGNVGGAISNSGTLSIINSLIYGNTAIESAADLYSDTAIRITYDESFVFDEEASGWHSDTSNARKGEKLFDVSFTNEEGVSAGHLVFLMKSDLPVIEPEIPVTPEPTPVRPSRPSRPSVSRPTVIVQPIVQPVEETESTLLDSSKALYLTGFKDALADSSAYISRSDVAKILYRLFSAESLEKYECVNEPFSDVENNTAIATLANANIIVGYDGRYFPDAYLSLGELCALLSRFSDITEGASSYQNIENHWAKDYINICVTAGWLDDGTTIDLNSYVSYDTAISLIEKIL